VRAGIEIRVMSRPALSDMETSSAQPRWGRDEPAEATAPPGEGQS
jgi:hypothetical protein